MKDALYSLIAISLCLLFGYVVKSFFGGLPSSLYGMVTFTLLLHFRLCDPARVKVTVAWAIKHMGICFVPAGVGIINNYQLIKNYGLALVSITFLTTFFVLTLVGVIFQYLENKSQPTSNSL